MRTGLRLALLAAIAVTLGAVYLYLARDTDPETTGVLYTFASGDRLQEMRITNRNGSVTLARAEDGKWALTQPGSYRANQAKARVMEEFLLNLPVKRQLDGVSPEYGLTDPIATVELRTDNGVRQTLLVGNLTASRAQVYLQDQTSGKVFVSDLGSVSQFDGSLDAYRDKDIFSVDKGNIVEFSYFADGEKKVTARLGEQGWQLTYPYEAPAREIEINEFLISLRKWSAIMYPSPEKLDYAGLGLDRPAHALEVADGTGRTQRIEFGAEADGLRFVRSGSQEDVAGIFAVDVDLSTLDADRLMFFQPLHTTIDRVASIEVISGGETTTFALDHTTDPPGVTANGRPIPYQAFVSFFVKYIALSADGHDDAARPGGPTMTLRTTFTDGSASQIQLLARDAGGQYLEVDGQASFYLSADKLGLLLDRLDAALAAGG